MQMAVRLDCKIYRTVSWNLLGDTNRDKMVIRY